MRFDIMKTEEGTIVIEGLEPHVALHLRRKIEQKFEALVKLMVCTDDHTTLFVRGVNDGPLGEDETAGTYRAWLRGWWCGYNDPVVGLGIEEE